MGKVARTSPSHQEELFIDEYLKDLDAERAALTAGYSPSMAKSKCTQWVSNSKNNPKPYIYIEITKRMLKASAKLDITKEMIIAEHARIAFAHMGEFASWNDNGVMLKDSSTLSERQLRAVSEVSHSPTGGIKMKLHKKEAALDSLAKLLGYMDIDKGGTVNNTAIAVNINISPKA